jgi:hypothetical protein
MDFQGILEEIDEITTKLKQGWINNDIESQKEYLYYLSITKARVNELKSVVDSFYLKDLQIFTNNCAKNLKQYEYKDQKELACSATLGLKSQVDNLSSTIQQQTEAIRTIISLQKEELRLTNTGIGI